MHRFWGWLGLNLGKHWLVVVSVGTLLTIFFGFGITRLEFATGQDSYLNKSDQVYKDSTKYQGLFGGQAMLMLVTMDRGHTVDELFTPEGVRTWQRLERELRTSGKVQNVVSPLTALQWTDNLVKSPDGDVTKSVAGKILLGAQARDTSPGGTEVRTKDAFTTLARLNAIPVADRKLTNPTYVDFLLHDNRGDINKPLRAVFTDNTHMQMAVRLLGNESIKQEGQAADAVRTAAAKVSFPNATVVTTGAPVLLKDLNDYLTGGMMILGGIAAFIMALILIFLFKVRWRLLPLLVVIIGVIWAFGIVGYLGLPLTIVTIAGLPVMLGIGIDYAIQMQARVEEEVVIDRAAHPIQEAARNLGPALLVVTFDAIFAFAALRFAKVPMIRQFGLLLAIGVATICLNSIVAPLAILGIREYKSPTHGKDWRAGPLGRFVEWLGGIPWRWAPFIAIASLVVFLGGVVVEGKLVLQTDPVKWVNQKSQVIKDLNKVDAETGSSSELGVFVQAQDPFSDKTVAWLDGFTNRQLKQNPETLLTASGVVSTVSDLMDVPGAGKVVPTGEEVKAAYDVAPKDVQLSTVDPNQTAMNVIFRTGPSGLDQRAVVVRQIRKDVDPSSGVAADVPPQGVRATPSGLAVLGVGLLDNLEANRIMLTYVAILFVFLFLSVRLRSVVRALLSLVPVLIAVGAASIFAYVLGLKLSPMTAVGGPLVVAACTEFTSLILLRFLEERRRGLPPKEAVDVTASRTGRAFIVSALTAIVGVLVIATSSLPLLRDFGLIVGINVAVALASALIVLPPLLVWADQRNWVSRGMVPTEMLVHPTGERAATPGEIGEGPAPVPA